MRSPRPEYHAWRDMHRRCKDHRYHSFYRYGGRGIKICKRWNTFSAFLKDMGQRPAGMTLDRIDNDRGYKPSNCRWASRKEQASNTRRNIFIDYEGETITLSELARRLQMNALTLWYRIHNGWSINDAITKPVRKWPSQYVD